MGYTHYFKMKKKPTKKAWNQAVADCKKLIENLPLHTETANNCSADDELHLNGCFRYEKPVLNEDIIHFNGGNGSERVIDKDGDWEDSIKNDLGHETFHVDASGKELSGYCKTSRKPYDLAVAACLIVLSKNIKGFSFETDGKLDDWKQAIELVQSVLKYDGVEVLSSVKDIKVA
jgi:hypothetical protein